MGTKITGIHAIEEALKNASHGSTLYLLRGDKRNSALEFKAMSNGKTAVKKVRVAIEANDMAAAAEAFESAKSVIDKAASKGVLHKNTAARKVARLAAAVNKAQ